jgi:soluble lytic murein transglycosylase
MSVWTEQNSHLVSLQDLNLQLPQLELSSQKLQARELLKRAPQSLQAEEVLQKTGQDFIFETVSRSLPAAYQEQSYEVAQAVIEEANRNGMDPIFLLAVIKTESHFNPMARGTHGEIGLMQILPQTAREIARKLKLPGDVNLQNPVINIRVGAAHFAQLRKHFAQIGSRYISAYNMGTRNVQRLINEEIEPSIYATRVLNNYRGLYGRWMTNLPAAESKTVVSLN